MTKRTRAKLKAAQQLPYLSLVREQLKETKTRVRKWVEWNPDSDVYEACFSSRRVVIPIPTCEWSFLVCLHEIGHISTGERVQSYLSEYNAERWAIARAKQRYSVSCSDYDEDAKMYVHHHLMQNILYHGLDCKSVRPYVLDWLHITSEELWESVQLTHGRLR